MHRIHLEELLISLQKIRVAIHNEANACAIEELDRLISGIEKRIENDDYDRMRAEILTEIGKFLEKLSSISALIKHLFG